MMSKNITVLAAITLAGCTAGKDSGNETVDPGNCAVTAAAEYPVDGQPDAYYRSRVEFDLSDADDTASVALADSSGAAVDGTSSLEDDAELVVFTPASPLAPSTSYTATLTWCGGENSITFTTSALGAATTVDLVGKTYNVDITSGRFVEPAGVGDLLGGLLENSILFGVTEVTDSSITFRGAISEEGNPNQDVCTPSLNDFPAADYSDPFFNLTASELNLSVAGFELNIDAINIAGTFAADGSYFGGGELNGELDARDIGPLLKGQIDDTSPDAICDLLIGFGVSCAPCSSDGESYCANVVIDQLIGTEQTGEVQEINQEDCFEGCAASCDNAECAEASTFDVCN
jgi:hypothetical protein